MPLNPGPWTLSPEPQPPAWTPNFERHPQAEDGDSDKEDGDSDKEDGDDADSNDDAATDATEEEGPPGVLEEGPPGGRPYTLNPKLLSLNPQF